MVIVFGGEDFYKNILNFYLLFVQKEIIIGDGIKSVDANYWKLLKSKRIKLIKGEK